MADMSRAMEAIKTSSAGISKIIKTIDEIAFQTNILALNAAVEAARAGEAGLGFAVVAEEVRNLAQRSAAAARETTEKIEDSIESGRRGAELSGKVETSLREILVHTRKMDTLVAEIAQSLGEQSIGVDQVNSAVRQLETITQANAATAEQAAASVEVLSARGDDLADIVAVLRRMVRRDAAPAAVSPAEPVPARRPHSGAPAAGVLATRK
jgi:methyl-accepting chemotaxis protein